MLGISVIATFPLLNSLANVAIGKPDEGIVRRCCLLIVAVLVLMVATKCRIEQLRISSPSPRVTSQIVTPSCVRDGGKTTPAKRIGSRAERTASI